jgi:hypothetical protein
MHRRIIFIESMAAARSLVTNISTQVSTANAAIIINKRLGIRL